MLSQDMPANSSLDTLQLLDAFKTATCRCLKPSSWPDSSVYEYECECECASLSQSIWSIEMALAASESLTRGLEHCPQAHALLNNKLMWQSFANPGLV